MDDFGLDSLAADLNDSTVSAEIAIEKITADPNQPRTEFDADALNDLAESIQAQGVVQPVVLREDKEGADRYIIIMGERRWRAAQIAGLETIPSIVKDYDDEQILAIQIIENIDRSGFILADEVRAVGRLVEENKTQKAAGDAVGKGKTWIAKRLAIFKSNPALLAFIDDGMTGDLEGAYQLSLLLKKYPEEGQQLMQEMRDYPNKRKNFRQQVLNTMERLNNPGANKSQTETQEVTPEVNTEKVSHEKLISDEKVAIPENTVTASEGETNDHIPQESVVTTVTQRVKTELPDNDVNDTSSPANHEVVMKRRRLSEEEFTQATESMQRLSERPKKAAYRVIVDGCIPDDVGKELGISQQAVSKATNRVLSAWDELQGGELKSYQSAYLKLLKEEMESNGYPEDWVPVVTILPPDVAHLVREMEKKQLEKAGL